jgi:hypothetical protein
MTLLESVLAFVLLAVVGVACLDLAQGASGLENRSVEWARAVAASESAMAAAAAGVPAHELSSAGVRVARSPWRGGDAGVELIVVDVALPGGAEFRTSRLVRVRLTTPGNGSSVGRAR